MKHNINITSEIIYENNYFRLDTTQEGHFLIFWDTKMWPYGSLHFKENTFFNEEAWLRWWKNFPFFPKNNQTEIFLLDKNIILWCLERTNINGEKKKFIDIINVVTRSKYRLEVDEVFLIYNTQNFYGKELVINYSYNNKHTTLYFDIETLNLRNKEIEYIECSFNQLEINGDIKFLNYVWYDNNFSNVFLDGYFNLNDENLTESYFIHYVYPVKKIVDFYVSKYNKAPNGNYHYASDMVTLLGFIFLVVSCFFTIPWSMDLNTYTLKIFGITNIEVLRTISFFTWFGISFYFLILYFRYFTRSYIKTIDYDYKKIYIEISKKFSYKDIDDQNLIFTIFKWFKRELFFSDILVQRTITTSKTGHNLLPYDFIKTKNISLIFSKTLPNDSEVIKNTSWENFN